MSGERAILWLHVKRYRAFSEWILRRISAALARPSGAALAHFQTCSKAPVAAGPGAGMLPAGQPGSLAPFFSRRSLQGRAGWRAAIAHGCADALHRNVAIVMGLLRAAQRN